MGCLLQSNLDELSIRMFMGDCCNLLYTIHVMSANADNNYSVFHRYYEKNNIRSLDLAGKITPVKYK